MRMVKSHKLFPISSQFKKPAKIMLNNLYHVSKKKETDTIYLLNLTHFVEDGTKTPSEIQPPLFNNFVIDQICIFCTDMVIHGALQKQTEIIYTSMDFKVTVLLKIVHLQTKSRIFPTFWKKQQNLPVFLHFVRIQLLWKVGTMYIFI